MRPRKRLVQEWVEKARHDFETAERELHLHGWPDIICFHCQQTVEKLLKAVLVSYDVDITRHRVHDLTHLLDVCVSHNRSLASLRPACKQLTGYYIAARYPIGTQYSQEDARRAVGAARKAVKLVLRVLER